jgi:hypothetical protein
VVINALIYIILIQCCYDKSCFVVFLLVLMKWDRCCDLYLLFGVGRIMGLAIEAIMSFTMFLWPFAIY